jgi:hypothetical protein
MCFQKLISIRKDSINQPQIRKSMAAENKTESELTEQQQNLRSVIGSRLGSYVGEFIEYADLTSETAFCRLFEPLYDWLLKNVKVPEDVFEAPNHFNLPKFDGKDMIRCLQTFRSLKMEEELISIIFRELVLGLAVESVLKQTVAITTPTESGVYIIEAKNLPAHL